MEVFPSENGVLTAEPFNEPGMEELAYVSDLDRTYIGGVKTSIA